MSVFFKSKRKKDHSLLHFDDAKMVRFDFNLDSSLLYFGKEEMNLEAQETMI